MQPVYVESGTVFRPALNSVKNRRNDEYGQYSAGEITKNFVNYRQIYMITVPETQWMDSLASDEVCVGQIFERKCCR
jgi:hypothetical protein